MPQDEWSYESVEYSDGYYHTVFNSEGKVVCECATEQMAKQIVENHNRKPGQ